TTKDFSSLPIASLDLRGLNICNEMQSVKSAISKTSLHLRELHLENCQLNDDMLRDLSLEQCRSLQLLKLGNNSLSYKSFEYLNKLSLPALTTLSLECNHIEIRTLQRFEVYSEQWGRHASIKITLTGNSLFSETRDKEAITFLLILLQKSKLTVREL